MYLIAIFDVNKLQLIAVKERGYVDRRSRNSSNRSRSHSASMADILWQAFVAKEP